MVTSSTYRWIQTAHYSAILLYLLALLSLLSTSRGATIRVPSNCVCTTQEPSVPSKFDITGSTPSFKETPTGVSTVLLPPNSTPDKIAFTLSKRIKMADSDKSGNGVQEVVATKDVAPKEVDRAVPPGRHRDDHQGTMNNPQDNIIFPKDDEPTTPTSAIPKTKMPIGTRILISGEPNDGYGRDENGEIVEIFQ